MGEVAWRRRAPRDPAKHLDDVAINATIAKTHNLAILTMGMKNLMGVIQDRGSFHSNMGQRLADWPYVRLGAAMGLGVVDLGRVAIREVQA